MSPDPDVKVLGSGPALVMLHGAGGTARDNFPFLDQLAESFTVVAPALRCELGENTEILAGRVLDACDERGIIRFSVCGYSMGTTVAATLAGVAPDRVDRLALCAGFAIARPSFRSLIRVWRDLLAGPDELLGRFIASTVFRADTLDGLTDDELCDRAREIGASQTAYVNAHLDLIEAVDTRPWLRQADHPTLVVVPEHDTLVHPGHSDDLLACLPGAVRHGLAAGHALGEEAPREWLAALRSFLRPT